MKTLQVYSIYARPNKSTTHWVRLLSLRLLSVLPSSVWQNSVQLRLELVLSTLNMFCKCSKTAQRRRLSSSRRSSTQTSCHWKQTSNMLMRVSLCLWRSSPKISNFPKSSTNQTDSLQHSACYTSLKAVQCIRGSICTESCSPNSQHQQWKTHWAKLAFGRSLWSEFANGLLRISTTEKTKYLQNSKKDLSASPIYNNNQTLSSL